MLERRQESRADRRDERPRRPSEAPGLEFGSKAWASALGSAAVARIARGPTVARQPVEAADEAEAFAPEAEPESSAEPMAPEADAAPDAEAETEPLDALPEDHLPE